MYRGICVPLDGTTESEYALSPALAIARKSDCPVDLVHVAFPAAYGTELYGAATLNEPAIEALRRDAEQKLRDIADQLESFGVRATVAVLQGKIPETLAEHFQTSRPDLVVMTTHDRSRLEHLLLGSVAESVVRRVHLPILLVRTGQGPPDLSASASVARILIPLDGSPFGEQVIPHAATLATLMSADVILLTVVQIAMTTHGRGALKRLVAGSVSEEVLRTSPTLMLMYRPEHEAA